MTGHIIAATAAVEGVDLGRQEIGGRDKLDGQVVFQLKRIRYKSS